MSESNSCEESNSCPVGHHLAAFAIGALVGAGLAIFYAPCSGKETREKLARRTNELKDKAGDVLEGAKEKIRETKTELVAAVEAGKAAMREERAKQHNDTV